MSSTEAPWTTEEPTWRAAAERHACRSSLWAGAGDPQHLFVGRPLDGAGGRGAPEPEGAEIARRSLDPQLRRLVTLRQEHGVTIHRVRPPFPSSPPAGDGLSTDDPSLLLGVQTADCVPILLTDRRRRAVAALHAGWRGTAAGIAPAALEHMMREYGSAAADVDAVLGPAVGGCCYEVGAEVREALARGPLSSLARFEASSPGRWRIDLGRLNAAALAAAGLRREAIRLIPACTRCQNARLHSFRSQGAGVGRNWSFIGAPAPGSPSTGAR
jgi:hypothetical protein